MVTPLIAPRHGVPEVISNESDFEKLIAQLLNGSGPLAIDAERASGYRYSQRAYLIQIYRENGGLHLIDPIPLKNSKLWQKFNDQFSSYEWVIHASTQDLPCLIDVGLKPELLFDTELGARIAGCDRVGLGPLAESLLELQLAKEHSAVDWSTRPLRPEWITYAALDVDILLDIRNAVEQLLTEQNKLKWAKQDFASILKGYQNYIFTDAAKPDRWRRTSGMHKVRDRLTMAIVRDLWLSRDELAREIDLAPGRVLGDDAIIELATKRPDKLEAVAKLIGRRTRLDSRAALIELSTQIQIPTENLVTPELVRKICWQQPPASSSEYENFVIEQLTSMGARPWQIELVTPAISASLPQTEPLIIPEPAEAEGEPEVAQ